MKLISPAFGLISGGGTALGLLPHILTLCVLLITGLPPRSVTSLIVFTVGAKLLGEWLFWNHCKRRMDSEVKLKNWRAAVDQSLLSHPNVFTALLMMFADALVDATLVYTALKTSLPPTWVFLALLGCQLLSSPIQGVLSDYFSQKKSLLFAASIGIIAVIFSLELPVHGKIPDPSQFSLLNLTGLSSFTLAMQMALILCGKGLLGNLTVIARAAIAEVIKVETIEKFSKV
jgi:hypothetical protein